MRKIQLIIVMLLGFSFSGSAQLIQLFVEDFETGGGSFLLNQDGPSTNIGNNKWTVNNEYIGAPLYPNTTNQDSTVSGTINNSPFSTYLHIYDSAVAPNPANSNFDPNNASDNFAYAGSGFCTLGMVDVRITFFWMAQGDTNAYGEVYYSADGGPWTKVGANKYNSQTKWKYEVIQDPAFENVQDLRFGFRWVNPSGSTPARLSFGIDDIIVVGNYDPINNPVNISISNITPSVVCQLDRIFIFWDLSGELCLGTYNIELSNAQGNFGGNPTSLGVFNIAAGDTSGIITGQIPATTPAGTCYRIRLRRTNPLPVIIGDTSVCFEVQVCPNTIQTLAPVVLTDPDTACVQSVIDVPFISTGVYNPNNVYTAQLSDSSGSFANPLTVGTLPSSTTYDPAIGNLPGTVSGLIPIVPEGCNYFIRVVSNSPNAIGTTYGPFCLKHCDMTTNNTQDMSFCVSDTLGSGICDSIDLDINSFNNNATYQPGNEFQLELLDMMSLALINVGGLAAEFDTLSGKLEICVPYLADLSALGIAPGTYYARIISDSSTVVTDQNGTMIRITIGAPASNPPIILLEDTVSCNAGILPVRFAPWNPDSEYEWLSPLLNNGVPFQSVNTPPYLFVNFTGANPNDYVFFIREINFGCYGAYSDPATVFLITVPDVSISGPTTVCLGDTVVYSVDFIRETFYDWDVNWGRVVEESNNEVSVVWDSIGTARLFNLSLNECGLDSGFYFVDVVAPLQVDAGPDDSLCLGEEITLTAATDGYEASLDMVIRSVDSTQGVMFDITAKEDFTITNFEMYFTTATTTNIEIYRKAGTYQGSEQNSFAWTPIGVWNGLVTNGPGVPTPFPIALFEQFTAGETRSYYITTTDNARILCRTGVTSGTVAESDFVMDVIPGTKNIYPYGAFLPNRMWIGNIDYSTEAGLRYRWSTGDTTATITFVPTGDSVYQVRVSDTTGCGNKDEVFIAVSPVPNVDAGIDTAKCEDEELQLSGTADGNYAWLPNDGITDLDILNPFVTPIADVVYTLTATDPISGCQNSDTVKVDVDNCLEPIKVPQAFSPNADGNNDFFTVFADGITEYEIMIYNRWGERVYYSNDVSELNDLNRGWDGSYKGVVQNIGTFVYYIRAVNRSGETSELQGNITLIR